MRYPPPPRPTRYPLIDTAPQDSFIPGAPSPLPLHIYTAPHSDYWTGNVASLAPGKYATKSVRSAPVSAYNSTPWETYPQTFNDLCSPSLSGNFSTYLGLEPNDAISGV